MLSRRSFLSGLAALYAFPAEAGELIQELRELVPAYKVVPTTTDPVTTTFGSGLFMEAGVVEYNDGVRFDVTEQGLLSLFAYAPTLGNYRPYADGGYRVVKKAGALDHYAIIGALGALISYGSKDESLTVAQRLDAMRTRKIEMRCGPTTETVRAALAQIGVTTRQVHFLTGETPTNFDDGHVALEALIDGQWRFFEVPGDGYFTDGTNHLSVADMIDLGVANATNVKLAVTEAGPGQATTVTPNGDGTSAVSINLRALWDQRYSTEALYLDWCRRIFQIPGIYDDADGLVYYYLPSGLESREQWVLGLSSGYRVLSKSAWLAKFYPA